MRVKKLIIGGALIVLGVPALLVGIGVVFLLAVCYYPNRTTATPGTIVSSGETRDFLLYVPKTYDPSTPTPLVISMHAAMSWPSSQMYISQWNRVADRNGIIVVYPSGTGVGPKAWFMEGSRNPGHMPDVVFISRLIDTLEATYNIDPTRIYADGLSNGGGMAFALSCTLSSRVAAIGAVSAAQSLPWTWCADSNPVPMIEFHGTADPFVPYDGAGTSLLNPEPFPNVRRWVTRWARRNRCAPQPEQAWVAHDVVRLQYVRCADDASVVLYTIRGGGHQWPGGTPLPEWFVGPATRSIDATSLLWTFYQAHRLRKR